MCFTNVNEAGIMYRYFMYSTNKCTDFNKNITLKKKTLDPMGKYSNAFFSETTNMIKAKLYMNVH